MWLSLCWRASAARSGSVGQGAEFERFEQSGQVGADWICRCTMGGHVSRSPQLWVRR